MPEADIQRYTKALQSLDEVGNRTYKTLIELQSQLTRDVQNKGLSTEIQRITAQLKEMAAAYNSIRSQLSTARAGQAASEGFLGAPGQRPSQSYQEDIKDAQQKKTARQLRQEAEAAKIKALQQSISAETKYTRALELASQQGYSLQNLYQVRTRGTGGVEQLRFGRTDQAGVNRQLDLFVNQSGRATPGISNQFRTFGQGVVRDIGELTKWSIALAAIYGPMRKLSELTEIMIENQTKLAEATIAVSSSFTDQSDIFEAAADAANASGEAITGVIEAFTQAYRATGGAGTEIERFATANKLLADALVLSKLSSLDQTGAIDTLSAAVRQTGGDFSITTDLLDKWVRVTKIANVDLASLATGFAVLGDAAEAAGISTDELNGIIAAIAETGIGSAKESANIARAIVAGFQSDKARAALESYGIAVEDSTGKLRDHLDVARDIYNLRKAGVLGEEDISGLGLAIGQGTRRGAAVTTYLENLDRVFEISKESSKASGDAQAALAKQLETVQTSLTRLGNAFQELAQTMGTEGGFLSIITEGVNGLTGLVNIFEDLISLLGKATPAIAAFSAASIALKYQGVQGGIQGGLGTLAGNLSPTSLDVRLAQATGGNPQLSGGRAFLAQNVLGTNVRSGAIQGIIAAALPAYLNATNQQDRFGGTKAVADVIGGVGGGIVGSLVAGSPIIGAAVGTAIAEAFVNSTIDRETDLFAYANTVRLGEPGAGPQNQENIDQALRDAVSNIYKDIGGGSEQAGLALTSGAYETGRKLVDQINKAIEDQDQAELDRLISGRYAPTEQQLQNLGLSSNLINQAFQENRQIQYSPESIAYQLSSPELQRAYDEALSRVTARGGGGEGIETPFTSLVAQNNRVYEELLDSIKVQSRNQLTQQRISGDVTGADYARRVTALGGFDTKALQYYTQLGDSVENIGNNVETAADAFEILNRVIITGASDSIPEITSLGGEIEYLINLLNDPTLKEDLLAAGGVEEVTNQLRDLQEAQAQLISQANQKALLQGLDIPEIQGDINDPLSRRQFNQTLNRAQQLQDEFYQGFLGIPDDMYDALKDSWDEFAAVIEDSGKTFYERVTDIDPKFFQEALKETTGGGQFNVQTIDLPSSEKGRLQSLITYYNQYLQKQFPQYQLNDDEFGVIFKDNVTDILHGDNLAVKLALEKLIDVNQKQLDGIYNLPEGATGFLPYELFQAISPAGEGLGSGEASRLTGGLVFSENEKARAAQDQLLEQKERYLGLLGKGNKGYTPLGDAESADRALLSYSEYVQNNKKGLGSIAGSTGRIEDPFSAGAGIQGLMQSIKDFIQSIGIEGYGSKGGQAPFSPEMQVPEVSNKLDISFDSNVQLLIDGRVVANIVKSYLANELLTAQQSQSTVTRRYVI